MTLLADALYLGGIEIGSFEVYQLGKLLWAISIIVSAPMAAALTLSFMMMARKQPSLDTDKTDHDHEATRRSFLRLALVPPLLAGTGSLAGLIQAQASPVINRIALHFPGLPEDLDGLSILHITDAHLGPFIEIDSIEDTIEALEGAKVDLVAITGDFADHLRMMKPAIERLETLKPTHGIFFAMGNHEYYHPEGKVAEQLEALSIQPLISSGVPIKVGDTILFVAGADDPARTEAEKEPFLRTSIEQALSGRPNAAFTLLLSHRPAGFDIAQEMGVELTLAGDTHGYQLGIGGQSALHPLFGEEYPRGHYTRGTSHLYTSTGLGHWFPYRLGCDREAALLTLRRGKA